jgi:hypothetical protein
MKIKLLFFLFFQTVLVTAQQIEPIQADRPDQTETPYLVPSGMFQVETGFSFQKNDAIIRKKERVSFIDPNYQYDLTIVNETINNITKEKYEIEIELLVNKDTLTWTKEYINDFIECKIYDLVNIVEPIERDTFKINLF